MSEQTKPCTKCGETLPLDDFRKHPKGKAGRQPACRACEAAARRIERSEAVQLEQQQHQAQTLELAQVAAAEAREEGRDAQLGIFEALLTDEAWAGIVAGFIEQAQRGSVAALKQIQDWEFQAELEQEREAREWARQQAG